MKNKFLLGLLLLGSFSQNTIFAGEGAAAAAPINQVPSLQDIICTKLLQNMAETSPNICRDPELFEAAISNRYEPIWAKNLLIAKYKEAS